jgi:8-amino-7-oxononanoate synthase
LKFHARYAPNIFWCRRIRYPTVAKGSARLRITVTADHDDAQIGALCEALSRLATN